MKHSVRLAIAFFLLSTVPVAFVTLVSTINAERTIEREVEGHLLSITEMRAADLDRWISSAERMIESIAQRPLVVDLTAGVVGQVRGEVERDPTIAAQLHDAHLMPHLRAGGLFEAFSIVDADTGEVLVSTDVDQAGKFRIGEHYFKEGLTGTYVDNVMYTPALERLTMHVATPIRRRDDAPTGVLVGRLGLGVIDEIITPALDRHETEDLYLVNAFGFFVTEPRHGDGFALWRNAQSEGVDRAIAGQTGVTRYEDYRDVPVLGAFRWLPDKGMALIAELEQEEVFALVGQARTVSYALLAGAVVVFTALGFAVARQIAYPLRRITAGAAKVGRGEFDHRIGLNRPDELGELARSFDQMTENLQRITTSRDELQREVSKRLSAEDMLRQTLDALRESEAQFRLLSEASPVGVCILQDSQLEYVNLAMEGIFGLDRGELLGLESIRALVHPEDREDIRTYVRESFDTPSMRMPLVFRGLRADGQLVPCEAFTRPIEHEGSPALLMTITDTTLRRQAEERFRLAAQVASDLIYEWDVETDGLTWFGDIDAALGYEPGEIAPTIENWAALIHPDDRVRLSDAVERHRTSTEPIYEAYRIRHKDGSWRHWIDRGVPILLSSDRPTRWIGVCIDETDRMAEYRARVESEQRFRRILENAPDIIYRYRIRPTPGFDYISGASEAIIGYRPEELMADPNAGEHLLHPQDRHQFGELLSGDAAEEIPHSHRWIHKDGHVVWIEDIHVPIHDESGRLMAIEGIARDVTERFEAERALRTADDIVRSIPTGLLILCQDAEGAFVIESANQTAASLIVGSDKILDGKRLDEVFPPPMISKAQVIFSRALETGTVHDDFVVVRGDDGIRFAFHLRAFRIPENRIVSAFEDITLQKQAEEALRISEQQHRSLFENAALGIYQTTPDGRILAANPALVRMLGYEAFEELAVRNLEHDGYEPETSREHFKNRIETAGRLVGSESVWKHRDGSRLVVRENAVAVRNDQGEVLFYEGTVEDITAQREAEEERQLLEATLRQTQKLESIGTLASGVAHEINNPLTGMINYAELIGRRVDDERLRDYANAIMTEGGRVAKIVRNLLSFSRHERESHSPARLADILAATMTLVGQLMKRDHVVVDTDVSEDLPSLTCRSQQIQQVLLNLLTNARDALNERYPGDHPDKHIRVAARTVTCDGMGWIRTVVEDHGAGIAPEDMDRIFDPFFTTKPRDRGTGLGLSVSYGIVRDHRGRLTVESEVGAYTRFTLDLPVGNERAPDD